MSLARFSKECPGLAGSLSRLFGHDVVARLAVDYCVAADLGGNVEVGLTREEGVSFNPRIARVVSLVIQECEPVDLLLLRVAVYSSVPKERAAAIPADVASAIGMMGLGAFDASPPIQGVSLACMLDQVRHLHMSNAPLHQKQGILDEVRSSRLLLPESGAPERLRVKVLHALDLQARRLSDDIERGQP